MPGGKSGLFQNTDFVLLAFLLIFTIKCLSGGLKDFFLFVYSRAEREFKIVFTFIPFNQQKSSYRIYIDSQTVFQTNQPTSTRMRAPEVVLASFKLGA